jgi:brefeldin A-inhibited guanine nucleotide-exchange protein
MSSFGVSNLLSNSVLFNALQEVQAKLQEAVLALYSFQAEPWPPSAPPKQPDWMKEKKSPEKKGPSLSGQLEQSSDTASVATVETDVESVAEDFNKETQQDDLKPFDEASVAPGEAEESARAALEVDDPQTKEFVHEAIVLSLEAYSMCMAHPSRTIKSCEYALECVQKLVDKQYVSGRAGGHDENQKLPSEDSAPPLMQQLMEAIAKCSESNAETVEIKVVQAMKSIMTSPRCGIHEASMLLAVRSTFHIYLVTKSHACQPAAKTTLLDMLHSIFARMEAMEAMLSSSTNNNDGVSPTSQYHNDSYVLFRSLCKLSSKELPGMEDGSSGASSFLAQQFAAAVDPLALNNKVLSLELILALMERAGDAVCHGERFIHLVQTQLCVALLKNCMSNHVQVAFLSQKIFLILVYKFKSHLKQEIEVFMSNIFLRVLDSPNSSFKQKALVLESLRSLCNDPVLLTQIFLNYDCDFDAMNLYKDIVFNLTKLSGKSTAMPMGNLSKKEADQHNELSLAGVEVLVAILKAFLRALGLPGGERDSDDTAGANIRQLLHLDVGDAARPEEKARPAAEENISNHGDNDLEGSMSGGLQMDIPDMRRSLQHQGSSSDVAGKIVDAFDRKRTAEQNFELGSVKFTLSLKAGLNFFVDNGFVTLDAKEIALFFIQNKDKLDKTQMGEVLGREPDAPFLKVPKDLDPEKGGKGFFVRILHHYADSMDFTGIMFDDAIRLFLSGFRLPGEAQKIDRIMEKFAQRFTEQNLEVFPSADTAFILAFSVIMLNTDLHNPSIKPERRMTQAGFVRNNKGIGENGSDLPEDFLIGIFDRIKVGPFSLKEDDAAREAVAVVESSLFFDTGGSFFRTSAEERRKEKFKKEREDMVAATEQLIRGRSKKVQPSGVATAKLTEAIEPADVVAPLFDVTWGPMIGILSQILECSNDERSIAVCLNGFVYAIRLAAHSNMSLARETFVNSLAKFTYLGSIKEMKRKNIESIRTLLSIAVMDGEYLGESWGPVLQCISQLSRMRMSASGLDSDESFLQDESKGEGGKKAPTPRIDVLSEGGDLFRHPTRAEINKKTEDNNGRAILAAVNEVLIDKVFSSTVKLSSRSLAHFIEQLVAVSNSEIDGESKSGITGVAAPSPGKKSTGSTHGEEGPSIFCLQKLVEVADYNMDVRPRLAWTQIWGIMAAYFAKIGCHKNSMVSFFAIDSLKQLSNKFLEKPELSEYNFQRTFLTPFLQIMETPGTREDTRQLILQCVDNTTRTKSHNLQSGWKIFFSILTLSASDPSEKINIYGLSILQRFLDEHLDQICRLSEAEEEGVVHEEENTENLTALERRNRNSDAEDFIEMCRASLSFVQTKESDSPRPVGSSMRALCHTAIFADLLAQHRVKPPVSGAQVTDPNAPGFTYEGLDETEELEMVLWRPIFEGLAEGIRYTASSQAGGVGNLVQRGSILALRAILLRHGSVFTINQFSAILQQTILPSMQRAVESDQSPVVSITSESPTVSSLDFLTDAMPLPPPPTDPGLMKFQEAALTNGL